VTRNDLINARVAKLASGFGHYVQVYDEQVSFTNTQLAAHRACLALREEAGSVAAAVHDDRFVQALRRVLVAWKVGIRVGRLVPEDDFAAALRTAVSRIEALEGLMIDEADLPVEVPEQIWQLVEALGVVGNKAKIVAGTKTLHHLLPDLVVPMDRAWTGKFFQFHLPEWQEPTSQRRIFLRAYGHFADVAREVQPQKYVTGHGWRTCRTKIVDNALIGFCKEELAADAASAAARRQITFAVEDAPPIKDGGMSIFGQGHGHSARVRALLEAARQALAEQDFQPIGAGAVSLDVVLHAPPGEVPGDATNYLGGIADVLEDKSHRGPLGHLDGLSNVWLYRNDRQIKEVAYREVTSSRMSYQVTVRSLPSGR
jgi:hypothetical protein